MSALRVHFGARPCASNVERKGGKLRGKVQHHEPHLPCTGRATPSVNGPRARCSRRGGRPCFSGGIAAQRGSSCQRISRRAATERCLAACVCDLVRVSDPGGQNTARSSLPCAREGEPNPLGSETEV